MKKFIFLFLFIGSFIGAYIPLLWGGSTFSLSSVLLSAVGGLAGIYVGYMIGNRFD